MKKQQKLILYALVVGVLAACNYPCNCTKDLGCTIISARSEFSDTIRETKTYCSQSNYATDKVLHDSITTFTTRNVAKGFTKIVERDSITSRAQAKIKGGTQKTYIDQGYDCTCPK